MKLPHKEQAIIEPLKIKDYLLSTQHPVGRFKAKFFSSLGYSRDAWERLDLDLRVQIESEEATLTQANVYGQKYEIRSSLTGPNGKQAEIVSIWIILQNDTKPRFITAYPGD